MTQFEKRGITINIIIIITGRDEYKESAVIEKDDDDDDVFVCERMHRVHVTEITEGETKKKNGKNYTALDSATQPTNTNAKTHIIVIMIIILLITNEIHLSFVR